MINSFAKGFVIAHLQKVVSCTIMSSEESCEVCRLAVHSLVDRQVDGQTDREVCFYEVRAGVDNGACGKDYWVSHAAKDDPYRRRLAGQGEAEVQ